MWTSGDRFRILSISHTGNVHEASVLKDSQLYKMANRLMPEVPCTINGTVVPKFLLGDAAYPLLPCPTKLYTGTVSPEEESFGVCLSSTRIAVENASGRLRARWRCLAKCIDINCQFVPQLIATCCVFHNIIEMHEDHFRENWLNDVDRGRNVPSTQ
ncbi:uncharacterized protein LOC126426760 [Schistocerca serialis cubense]|uniref:uncharacterized protein LOC126426760 n=1 Tax=Schistocerca serialis cubense TaxID=2023355 RepID=UPI00214E4BC8|nr:uncharacterized protein LOC126426760 [Schistocerca serialis cubense]